MATKHPRIAVALTETSRPIVLRIAASTGKAPGKVLRELVHEMTPALHQMADALELAKASEDKALGVLDRMLAGAVGQADQLRLELSGARKRLRKKPRGATLGKRGGGTGTGTATGTPARPARKKAARRGSKRR